MSEFLDDAARDRLDRVRDIERSTFSSSPGRSSVANWLSRSLRFMNSCCRAAIRLRITSMSPSRKTNRIGSPAISVR
ncbi:MAG: hypothetical protein IPK28_10890 [Devosia sp.]|nr:hypothetical protein [Devosia sp.]